VVGLGAFGGWWFRRVGWVTVWGMRLIAPAKLTINLRVTGVRDDGLHLIESEMVTLDLADELTINSIDGPSQLRFAPTPEAEGLPTDGTNLIRKALDLMGRQAKVVVRKNIPSEAGLGGGSADAAAIFRWGGMSDPTIAARLGADIPFCIVGGRALVSGIGEEVEPLPFKPMTFTLMTPPLACPTGAIYQAWDDLGSPEGENGNDLEPAALKVVPELARWRDKFGDETGQTPRLAGSGSTWFVTGAHAGPTHRVVQTIPATLT